MRQRGISEAEVEAVLSDYHTTYTDEDGNPVYIGDPSGRRVVVAVRRGSAPAHIITTWD